MKCVREQREWPQSKGYTYEGVGRAAVKIHKEEMAEAVAVSSDEKLSMREKALNLMEATQ